MEKLKEFRNVHLQVVARLVLFVTVIDAFGLMWVIFKVEEEHNIAFCPLTVKLPVSSFKFSSFIKSFKRLVTMNTACKCLVLDSVQ